MRPYKAVLNNSTSNRFLKTDMTLNVERIRSNFPILEQKIGGHPLVYLDNAATTLKPRSVIDEVKLHYESETSNVHRGVHSLSQLATEKFELSRQTVQNLINAQHAHEIIFTKGTTESINLIAQSYGRNFLKPSDEILITHMEHHANIVPWQVVAEQTGAKLIIAPINEAGELKMDDFENLINEKTKIVSFVAVSNTLGTINPVKKIINRAKKANAITIVDAAQAVAHCPIDVQVLDCDFLVFSGHKAYGPTGVGVLYGKESLLEKMPPYQTGGAMIESVRFEKTTYAALPHKFEAGTPPIASVIGLKPALDFIVNIGFESIEAYERSLGDYATDVFKQLKDVRIIGEAKEKIPVYSLVLKGIHPHDIGTFMDQFGIALRAGHHCTQPLMEFYGVAATARASFSIYNTRAEVDYLAKSIQKIQEFFQ